jgi:branched-chain amino acid transport system ATP-binding protein
MNTLLKFEDVSLHYGQLCVGHELNFEIKTNELVMLVGINGAGKSSILRAISGLSPTVSQGKIFFNEEQISGSAPHNIVTLGISHVPEGRRLFNNLTVKENLILGGSLLSISKTRLKERIDQQLEHFTFLREKLEVQANLLSGGEQQILAIARAMIAMPKLILLDEAFMGLSHKMRTLVKKTIIQLISDYSLSILLVDQSLDFVEDKHVSQVLYLESGYLVERNESFLVKNIK